MNTLVQNIKVRQILKSPHAEGLYRLNYNTIMSPVDMYIRVTDMQLIKNVHARTDRLWFTMVYNQRMNSYMLKKQPEKRILVATRLWGKDRKKFSYSFSLITRHYSILRIKFLE